MYYNLIIFFLLIIFWIISLFIMKNYLKKSNKDNKEYKKILKDFLILHSISGITILSFGIYIISQI